MLNRIIYGAHIRVVLNSALRQGEGLGGHSSETVRLRLSIEGDTEGYRRRARPGTGFSRNKSLGRDIFFFYPAAASLVPRRAPGSE